jgi:hypothetical protein
MTGVSVEPQSEQQARFEKLLRICGADRQGVVDGVEFDLRHPELSPDEWTSPVLGVPLEIPYPLQKVPSISFPWSPTENGVSVRSGDKITVHHVERVPTDDEFNYELEHLHDAQQRHAFLRVDHPDNTHDLVRDPMIFIGNTSIILAENRDYILSITQRACDHFNIIHPDLFYSVQDDGSKAYRALAAAHRIDSATRTVRQTIVDAEDDDEAARHAWDILRAVNDATLMGYLWAKAEEDGVGKMKARARSALRSREGAKTAGRKSTKTRNDQADEDWRNKAREMAREARKKHPEWSQDLVAADIADLWPTKKRPGQDSLIKLIRNMEKSGELSRMIRQK